MWTTKCATEPFRSDEAYRTDEMFREIDSKILLID